MEEKLQLQLFDCDGTHYRDSLSYMIVSIAIKNNFFPKKLREEYQHEMEQWKKRKGTFEQFTNKYVRNAVHYYANLRVKDFDTCVEIFLREYVEHEYRFTRALVQELKHNKKNHLVMISQSPERVVQAFAQFHGFHASFGSFYEVKGNKFTGNATSLMNKDDVARTYIRDSGGKYMLGEESYGVGDTVTDIPMLEIVGRPICMNPSRELIKHAQVSGWPMVIERKDSVVLLHRGMYRMIDVGKPVLSQLESCYS